MKKNNKIFPTILTVLIIAFAFPSVVLAAPSEGDQIVFGEPYTLESGRILDGNLILLGGVIDIESGAVVKGDFVGLGSVGNINGIIEGNLISIGGTITLEEDAVIQGNVYSPTSFITFDSGAVVEGDVIKGWDFPLPNVHFPAINLRGINTNYGTRIFPWFNRVAKRTAQTLIIVALSAIMLLIMPKSAEVMTKALINQPWLILGYGALTALVMLVGGVILSITICLIPMVILAGLAFGLAILAGWLALGYELGKRIATNFFKADWHPVLAATVGNLVLFLVAIGVDLIPCIGSFLVFLVALFGLGMAVVTLFGTRPFPRGETSLEKDQVILPTGQNNEEKDDTYEKETSQENGKKKDDDNSRKIP
jgi:hypothetical protein